MSTVSTASTERREPLILRKDGVTDRIDDLFEALSNDADLRDRFLRDPAQVLAEHVGDDRLPPQQESATNRLVHAVLSDEPLLRWLRTYAAEHRGEPPSRAEFMADFSRAVVEHGGDHAVLDLLRKAGSPYGAPHDPEGHIFTSGSIFVDGFIITAHSNANSSFHQIQSFQHSSEFDHTGGTAEVREASEQHAGREGGVYGSDGVRVAIDALVRHAAELPDAATETPPAPAPAPAPVSAADGAGNRG